MQRNVLADQHADTDARHIEPVQELVDLRQLAQVSPADSIKLSTQLVHASRDHRHDIIVAGHDAANQGRKLLLARHIFHRRKGAQLLKGLDIPIAHCLNRLLRTQAERQVLQLCHAVGEAYRQLFV